MPSVSAIHEAAHAVVFRLHGEDIVAIEMYRKRVKYDYFGSCVIISRRVMFEEDILGVMAAEIFLMMRGIDFTDLSVFDDRAQVADLLPYFTSDPEGYKIEAIAKLHEIFSRDYVLAAIDKLSLRLDQINVGGRIEGVDVHEIIDPILKINHNFQI